MKLLAYICLFVIIVSFITGIILTIFEKKGKGVWDSKDNVLDDINSNDDSVSNLKDFQTNEPFIISVIPNSDSTVVASDFIVPSKRLDSSVSNSISPEMDEEII